MIEIFTGSQKAQGDRASLQMQPREQRPNVFLAAAAVLVEISFGSSRTRTAASN
jgi:hypothetical protein